MKNVKSALNKQKIELLGGLLLLLIFVAPFLTFASSRNDIFVDNSKIGVEDGTQARPYHTISEALIHADKRTDVHVAKGVYEENIEIPKGVKIFGSDRDEVIIRAKNRKKVVVSMKDDTEINKVTIEKGNEGVWIKKDAEVSIIKCIIRNNDDDGINIASGGVKKNNAVNIIDSIITENGRAGIFSQKRRLVLMNNEIIDNESDGVDLAAGSSAWIEDNKFKDNDGSGLKLRLDGSDIWTKSNTYRDNNHSGLEISDAGKAGRIDINKSKFAENKKYAVARIARAGFAENIWNGLTVQANNTFESSKLGKVSPIIRVK
jgi:hypothetical protein